MLIADVSSPEQVAAVVDEANKGPGRIDVLFNNAGISIRKPPQDLTPEEWHKVMDVNLTSAFLTSKAVYPRLKLAGRRRRYGHLAGGARQRPRHRCRHLGGRRLLSSSLF